MFNEFLAIRRSEELQQERLQEAEAHQLYKRLGHKGNKLISWVLLIAIVFLITILASY
jgi:hypothetical protein